jgi:hypothetical protein
MRQLEGIQIHPLAEAFPMIAEADWSAFVADIRDHGIRQPIVWGADGTTLIDGRNRLSAWLELGNTVESAPSTRLAENEDEFSFIVSLNLSRRQLTRGQVVCTAARAMPAYEGRAKLRQEATRFGGAGAGKFNSTAAEESGHDFHTGEANIRRAARLLRERQDLFLQVESGLINMHQAQKQIDKSVSSYTRTEDIRQPDTESELKPSQILEWFRTYSMDTAEETMLTAMEIMERRINSVPGGSHPFTQDEVNILGNGSGRFSVRAQERADIREMNDRARGPRE